MKSQFFMYSMLSLSYLGACSSGSETQSNRSVKKSSTDDGTLDCESQWALAVKQQPVGAVFTYTAKGTKSDLGGLAIPFTHKETVTVSSDSGISRKVEISGLSSFGVKDTSTSVTLTREKFLQTCKSANGQPATLSALGGTISFDGTMVDETISLSGEQINAQRAKGQASDIKYGGYSGSADVVIYVSNEYPALVLKQDITIKGSSISLANGAVLKEELSSKLPVK
jgi:hypothetical protein